MEIHNKYYNIKSLTMTFNTESDSTSFYLVSLKQIWP